MAKEDVARLFRDAKANANLREALQQAPTPAGFVEMARDRGYEFTVEEWQEMVRFSVDELKGELSEIPGL